MPSSLLHDLWIATDPVAFSRSASIEPDEWQAKFLRSTAKRILINCSRQSGKSTTAATFALHTALYRPGSMTVLLAPGLRQSTELMKKMLSAYRYLSKPVGAEAESRLSLELDNGSRILCLPGSEATVRGISGVDLLLVEEASRVPDDLYYSVRPMLATKPNARVVMMSTPFGTRGFFWEAWKQRSQWDYYEVPASRCPRITPEFLAEEKRTMGDWWYQQEYMCAFLDAQSAAFRDADIERMKDPEVQLWSLR